MPDSSFCRLRSAAALLALMVGMGCHEHPTTPKISGSATEPQLLSVNSPTKDEDPSVLLSHTGTLFAAWFSDRGQNPDVYVARSADGVSWSAPVRVSSGPGGDFYPNLFEDSAGTLHLVWFQWVALFVGQIRHSTSVDGVTWTPEEAVTTAPLVDDWVPTVAQAPNGTLLVYFAAAKRDSTNTTNQIYVAAKRVGVATWDPPVLVAGINSATEHDQLPFVARTGDHLSLAWVRYDTQNADFITNPRSDLYLATSSDGFTWSAPLRVTTDGAGQNLFPQLYQRHDGSWTILWLSTKSGSPKLYELPLDDAAGYPEHVVLNPFLPDGYSHRITRTAQPGTYLAAWVQGATGVQDIYIRLITTP